VNIVIALVATAALAFQMSYVSVAAGWAFTHGALTLRDLVVVAVPFAVFWIGYGALRLRQPAHPGVWLSALSVLLFVSTEFVLPVTPAKARSRQAAVDATTVQEIADEAILSERGQPVGIRLTYRVRFPEAGVYSVGPSIAVPIRDETGTIPGALHLGFVAEPLSRPEPARTGEPGERYFPENVDYRFTVDLVPSFLRVDVRRGERCIFVQPNRNYSEDDFLNVVTRGLRSRYRTELLVDGETFTRRVVARQYVTAVEYDVGGFYDALIRDGVSRCGSR